MLHAVDHKFFAGFRPMLMPQIAELQLHAGHADHAMATLDRAIDEARRQGNRYCEPELVRLRGEILRAQSRANDTEAEHTYRQAMTMAAGQPCPVLELRAATSLARLLADRSRREEAHDLLAPVYAGFTEGFGKPDLLAAKALLTELG